MSRAYSYTDLVNGYLKVGLREGELVYVAANLLNLGLPPVAGRDEILDIHYSAIREVIGADGTIVAPTYTFSYCNTDKIFDRERTPSETGPLTEYIRTRPEAIRQFHPFSSRVAIGPKAAQLCSNCSKHANGLETPFARMLEDEPKILSIGLEPRYSFSVIHHVEMEMGVPYRYVKEFVQPIVSEGKVKQKRFYLFVKYRDCDIKPDGNRKILHHFEKDNAIRKVSVGNNAIHLLDMRRLVQSTRKLMKKDIYCFLETPPTRRPYVK